MCDSSEAKCEPCAKDGFIPKHLYDVNVFFPTGVGRCSNKFGPANDLPKGTTDWLSKVLFKMPSETNYRAGH